ncbi:cytochrome P450 [Xylariales sp. PMI_506]|nr:cytochrome P450 [Xylariales sp. PMI_506]
MVNFTDLSAQTAIGLGLVYVVVNLIQFSLRSLRPKNYPPGPPALPFLGNIHQFAVSMPFLKFTEWSSTYGDIVGLKAGPENLVILNSARLVNELFERRGAIYSGRPFGYMVKEHIVRDSQHIIFLPHDGFLRRWRTAIRHLLSPAGCEHVLPIQAATSSRLVYELLTDPNADQATSCFIDHFHNWSMATGLIAVCGRRDIYREPHLIRRFFENQEAWLGFLTPGRAPPVDIFPLLKYVPEFLAGWKRKAKEFRARQRAFYDMMLESARNEQARRSAAAATGDDGTALGHESLMAKLLRERAEAAATVTADGKTPSDGIEAKRGTEVGASFNDDQLCYLGGGVLEASVDTTTSGALTLLKALAAHPDLFRRAQAEVDRVCGAADCDGQLGRLPQPRDLGQLPFLKACFLETLRWRPPAPSAIPHVLETDDTVNGYHLPKGTVLIPNIWAIQHDASEYDNPERFDPDRFLRHVNGTRSGLVQNGAVEGGGDSVSPTSTARKQLYAFGAGRRQCPGDQFAQNSVLLVIAKVIWAFDVIIDNDQSSKGEPAVDVDIESGFIGGLTLGCKPFKARFAVRSETRKASILNDLVIAKSLLE